MGVVTVFLLMVIGFQQLGSMETLVSPAIAAWLPLMIFVPAAVGWPSRCGSDRVKSGLGCRVPLALPVLPPRPLTRWKVEAPRHWQDERQATPSF